LSTWEKYNFQPFGKNRKRGYLCDGKALSKAPTELYCSVVIEHKFRQYKGAKIVIFTHIPYTAATLAYIYIPELVVKLKLSWLDRFHGT
jgi:hypothetical protein